MNKNIFLRGMIAVAMFGLVACGAPSITRAEAITKLDGIAKHTVGDTANFKLTMKSDGTAKDSAGKDQAAKAEIRLSVPDSYFYVSSEETVDGTTTKSEQWMYLDGTQIQIAAKQTGKEDAAQRVDGTADSWKLEMATMITTFSGMSASMALTMKQGLEAEGSAALSEGMSEKFTSTGDGNVSIEMSGTVDGVTSKTFAQFDKYLLVKMVTEGASKSTTTCDYANVALTKYSA
jgi:hypothetical protein